jgi:hypothetical protein
LKKKAGFIVQAGVIIVTIGIVIMFANSPEKPIAAALFMMAGILISIVGGLGSSMPKLEIAALTAIFIAVIFYFFTGNNLLANLFIGVSVFLVIVQSIIKFKKWTAPKQSASK